MPFVEMNLLKHYYIVIQSYILNFVYV